MNLDNESWIVQERSDKMISFENTKVTGWEAAVRGMRNPFNSWDESDSHMELILGKDALKTIQSNLAEGGIRYIGPYEEHFVLGPKDEELMRKLDRGGPDHAKFMRYIIVTVDIIAPIYWYKQVDTYKVGTVRNSCSTMHKLTFKSFEKEDFSIDHLASVGMSGFESYLSILNELRDVYLSTKDKEVWYQIIELLPESYMQRSTMQFSYENLHAMYAARKGHKLDEWHTFCDWCETLPHSWLITLERR